MDLLKYLIVGIGSVVLGIIVALVAHSIWAGIGLTGLSFVGFLLLVTAKGINPPPIPPQTPTTQDN